MKRAIIFLSAIFLLSFSLPAFALPPAGFSVVSSTTNEIIFEVIVPPPRFTVSDNENGRFYKVVVPGFKSTTFPGKPELPVSGLLVGIKDGSEPLLEILEVDKSIMQGHRISPTLTPRPKEEYLSSKVEYLFLPDHKTYSTDSFLYGNVAEIGFSGYMRDQKVAQIKLLPIQYNPVTEELFYYSRIRLKLSFHAEQKTSDSETMARMKVAGQRKRPSLKGKTGAYERLLKGVLVNYDQIRN